jgi:hypothetical protein
MTRLGTGPSGVRIPARALYLSLFQNAQTDFSAHPAFYWVRGPLRGVCKANFILYIGDCGQKTKKKLSFSSGMFVMR